MLILRTIQYVDSILLRVSTLQNFPVAAEVLVEIFAGHLRYIPMATRPSDSNSDNAVRRTDGSGGKREGTHHGGRLHGKRSRSNRNCHRNSSLSRPEILSNNFLDTGTCSLDGGHAGITVQDCLEKNARFMTIYARTSKIELF